MICTTFSHSYLLPPFFTFSQAVSGIRKSHIKHKLVPCSPLRAAAVQALYSSSSSSSTLSAASPFRPPIAAGNRGQEAFDKLSRSLHVRWRRRRRRAARLLEQRGCRVARLTQGGSETLTCRVGREGGRRGIDREGVSRGIPLGKPAGPRPQKAPTLARIIVLPICISQSLI